MVSNLNSNWCPGSTCDTCAAHELSQVASAVSLPCWSQSLWCLSQWRAAVCRLYWQPGEVQGEWRLPRLALQVTQLYVYPRSIQPLLPSTYELLTSGAQFLPLFQLSDVSGVLCNSVTWGFAYAASNIRKFGCLVLCISASFIYSTV